MDIDKYKVLDQNILFSEDTVSVAKKLLNKFLISKTDQQLVVAKIVETEAYRAPEDKASHAYMNKYTKRTSIMFGNAGMSYVYLCYGIHYMLNVVTGPEKSAHAVLIRAVEPLVGLEIIKERREVKKKFDTCNGPGKLCKALGINLNQNALDLCDNNSDIFIAENADISETKILKGPRVGVAYAKECANWPWRFRIKNNQWTSPPDKVVY